MASAQRARKLAVSLVGGMISSKPLTLVVIPAIYVLVKARQLRVQMAR